MIIAGIAAVATGAVYENWGAEALFTGASVVMVVALAGAIALGEELMGPDGRSRREQTPASS